MSLSLSKPAMFQFADKRKATLRGKCSRFHRLLPMMSFRVTKMDPVLVAPCEPTPSGHLPLSPIDTRLPNHFFPKMVHVYGRGENPAVVIKEAISKALVPYYPVAGRIQVLDDHDMVVNCNGAGVYFVEASADCSLGDASFLDKPPFKIPTEQLLPCPPPDVAWNELTFLMQVTQFKCGGFTVGIALNHIFFDGWGVAQLGNAIAEISRGLQPSAKPIWCRDSIQDPQSLSFVSSHHTLVSSIDDFEEYVDDISADQISRLRKYLMKQTGETYSTFDILAAITWQYRARILGLEPDTDMSLMFPIDMRRILPRVLSIQGTYYGNYYCDSILRASNKYVAHAPLAEIAKMVRNGKTGSYRRFLAGSIYSNRKEEPLELDVSVLTLGVTDWRGFARETDYGFGKLINFIPHMTDMNMSMGLCVLLESPVCEGGVRLWTHRVSKLNSTEGILDLIDALFL